MSKPTYITLVTLVCYVQGKRTEIPAGKPVPEGMRDIEIEELLASRSIERADAEAMAARQQQLQASATTKAFEAEKERLQAAREVNESAAQSATTSAEPSDAGGAAGADAKGGAKASTPPDTKDGAKK